MKHRYLIIIFFIVSVCNLNAQISVPLKVDTSKIEIKELYLFVEKVMAQETITKELWNPKYRNAKYYNYNYFIDWIWRSLPPKTITDKFDVRLVELQIINDTLSYFKLEVSNNDTTNIAMFNIYKYYIVKQNDTLYLDNCKEYDSYIFNQIETENIIFHISPFINISKSDLETASKEFDLLQIELGYLSNRTKVEYYMCSNESEMNMLSNIVVWNGGVGGFTNMESKYVVAISNNPFYKHEFVHVILGKGAPCFFLGEGIASLIGGLNENTTYNEGLTELKDCFKSGRCNFDNLYERKVGNNYNMNPTYAFAAVFCKWLISEVGLNVFYEMYYDNSINTNNFLDKVIERTGKSENEARTEIINLITK